MAVILEKISIKTSQREEVIDINSKVRDVLKKAKKKNIMDGVVRIFVPHTTAGITINENADPAVEKDMRNILKDLVPKKDSYLHREGNSDSHVKSSLMGNMSEILLSDGEMVLGTWQGVKFCEF